ncbi:MAG TPA: 2,3-diphosphoglycerate synthetase [Actinomycetota bacterium]|nr:2,3-diphosphoglycerate synthetase [Actinomycetota bacterium]
MEVHIRCLVIIDGEHYPPVIEAALREITDDGYDIEGALLIGGREKLPDEDLEEIGGVPIISGDDATRVLEDSIRRIRPELVIDLSDEPVLDYRGRHLLAGIALANQVRYQGADFVFEPPPRPRVATKPSIAVISTGKRTGKTAMAGFTARVLSDAGHSPVIVAMGRGGPEEPEVLRGDQIELGPKELMAIANQGRHAASDYIEDALLGQVPTVGCRRCGSGLAGGVDHSNVAEGVALANDLPGDLLILEGSGAAIPPVHADATIVVLPAHVDLEYLRGYMGPYRLLLSDLAVVTLCEEPFGSPSRISEITSLVGESFRSQSLGDEGRGIRVVRTVFRPAPTRPVDGKKAFVATTAPEEVGDSLKEHLEAEHGCEVVGMSHQLSDRKKLTREIEKMSEHADLLLCEIKAAGVDVATRKALDEGLDVVYMNNVPQGVEGDDPSAALREVAEIAVERFERSY